MKILTTASAVMDSFIHRCSSSKWPITIHAQSSATNRFIGTTELWSDDNIAPIFHKISAMLDLVKKNK
jgi:hypothetical protein